MQFGTIQLAEPTGLDLRETLLPQILANSGGYTNYLIGKWNLGHYCPQMLPTARGFHYFVGYLDGLNYYWSKRNPSSDKYQDFMYADSQCFDKYEGVDTDTYSSTLYGDKAVRVILEHDYAASPMFLYFSAQAVHDPFTDYEGGEGGDSHSEGISVSLVGEDLFQQVHETVVGGKRQQYALALSLLDSAVNKMYDALSSNGQLSNTYIVFSSDNGGCHSSGGKNGPLRGTKGSLFEGGTKVDAFVYSPLLPAAAVGTSYAGLMHVSDWLPTLLGLAGVSFSARDGYALDGVDQSAAIQSANLKSSPREFLLYNAYTNVQDRNFDLNVNGSVAVRNGRYKLMHGYSGGASAMWFEGNLLNDGAEYDAGDTSCSQLQALDGTFGRFLFDLWEDPSELRNLYGSESLADVQTSLYMEIAKLDAKEAKFPPHSDSKTMMSVMSYWKRNGNFLQPWDSTDKLMAVRRDSPVRCSKTDSVFSPVYELD
eukprot:gene27418-34131_t